MKVAASCARPAHYAENVRALQMPLLSALPLQLFVRLRLHHRVLPRVGLCSWRPRLRFLFWHLHRLPVLRQGRLLQE